jgi:uncharacterized protein YeaO (DUF488 family)
LRIKTKRVYEKPERSDGRRILVDRLWPRGLSKSVASVDFWARGIAPSNELRRFRHQGGSWAAFRRRYFGELDANAEGVAELRSHLGRGTVTLLYGSREPRYNNATALAEYLRKRREKRT